MKFADQVSQFFRATWEARAARARGAAEPAGPLDRSDVPAPHLCRRGPASLDLVDTRIECVIWSTGFGASIGWLPRDALRARGQPRLPGLHVVGAPWLTHRSSGNLYGIAADADQLASELTRRGLRVAA